MANRVNSVAGLSFRLVSAEEFNSKANFPSFSVKLMLLPLAPVCSVTTSVAESPSFARISPSMADLSLGMNKILHFLISVIELIWFTRIARSPIFFFVERLLSS